MDGALRQSLDISYEFTSIRLNPSCNGWCTSTRYVLRMMDEDFSGLNPSCNGWCTSTDDKEMMMHIELCLNPSCNGWCTSTKTYYIHRIYNF